MEENKSTQQPKGVLEVQAEREATMARIDKKLITWTLAAIAVVLVAAGVWYWSYTSGSEKENTEIGAADVEQNDSTKYAMYKKLADNGSYKAADRAKLMTAIKLYNDGKYNDAIKYLDGVKAGSNIIQTGVYSLQGDCYANTGKLDEALKCFDSALDEADENPQLVPFVLVKLANIYRAQKNYEKEYEVYSTLRTDYPGFMYDVEKYYERAKTAAGK